MIVYSFHFCVQDSYDRWMRRVAVIGIARSLATALGPDGITVNCVAPGLTRTPTAAITGQTLCADGGLVLR
jgi:hypothetical protein